MKHGKLSEGVYKLTVSSTGRTLVRAKMVKAIACKVKEIVEPETSEATAQDARWYSGCELLSEYGIPAHRLYGYREQIKRYIAKPDGVHYRYHEAMLSDGTVMELLTKPVRYRNTSKRGVAAEILARLKANAAAAQQAQEHSATETNILRDQSARYGARKIRCLETNNVFVSVSEGARAMGIQASAISRAIRKNYTCGGYHFEYV